MVVSLLAVFLAFQAFVFREVLFVHAAGVGSWRVGDEEVGVQVIFHRQVGKEVIRHLGNDSVVGEMLMAEPQLASGDKGQVVAFGMAEDRY